MTYLEMSFFNLERRYIASCIILTFVTCGIYGIYWLYCLIRDINTISEDPDSMSPIIVILLGIITCGIYFVYWFYKAGELLDQKAIEFGRMPENRPILYLIIIIVGYFIPFLSIILYIVVYTLLQSSINVIADEQNYTIIDKPTL